MRPYAWAQHRLNPTHAAALALVPWHEGEKAGLKAIVIRPARASDAAAIRRLAQLDSGKAPQGEALVAIVDGELLAALPLGPGSPIADPFHPTADLVELLRVRAGQERAFLGRDPPARGWRARLRRGRRAGRLRPADAAT